MIISSINILDAKPYTRRGKKLLPKTRIYFRIEGQTIIEHLLSRGSCPAYYYRKNCLGDVFKALDLPPDAKVAWNRYAGCNMCPCSPGFVMANHYGKDVHVRVNFAEETADVQEV